MEPNATSSGEAVKKAPVPQVDREHFKELRELEKNPDYIAGKKK
jgi:hypothetical protein